MEFIELTGFNGNPVVIPVCKVTGITEVGAEKRWGNTFVATGADSPDGGENGWYVMEGIHYVKRALESAGGLGNKAADKPHTELPFFVDALLSGGLALVDEDEGATSPPNGESVGWGGREPLPPWAVGTVEEGTWLEGSQLCTKDGRRAGNAVLTSWKPAKGPYCNSVGRMYCPCNALVAVVRTDIGNTVELSPVELDELFYPPQYLVDLH